MGIFIHLKVADTVTQSEWQAVYDKSLQMAKAFRFMDFGIKVIHGEGILCMFPTQEITRYDSLGWRVIGTMPDFRRAEDQFMPKDIGCSARETAPYDVLLSEIKNEERHFHYLWENKTQGEPYHMGLLAIACMAEQMLGVQATVGGDVTYGQCLKAAKIASDLLGETIQPPVSCRLPDLYERIHQFDGLSELEQLRLLIKVYLEIENDAYGSFLREHFSADTLKAYWQEEFRNTAINTYGFDSLMKRYFLLSPDMRRFCELVDFDRSDTEQCTTLIRKIIQSKMHLQEKDCYDPLDYKHYEIPYGIGNLMASFFLRGAANPAIDRYIPLDEIRTVLNDCFGAIVNVNEVMDSCLDELEHPTEESGHDMLMNYAESFEKKKEEKNAGYDIYNYEGLSDYKPGMRLSPGLQEAIGKAYALFHEKGTSAECESLLTKNPDELFHVLASDYDGCFLTEKHWEHIWDELHRDPQTFRRYYPMTRLTNGGDLDYLLRALLMSDDFWNYCVTNFKEEN